jgi:hypothetical protein
LVYDLNAKSLSHLAGHDRGAMAGAFRQEDVIWPFKDPKGGEKPLMRLVYDLAAKSA